MVDGVGHVGFRVLTLPVCSGDQGVGCVPDDPTSCSSAGGSCGTADIYQVTFRRSYALNNKLTSDCSSRPWMHGFASLPQDSTNRAYNITFDRCYAVGNDGDGFNLVAKFAEAGQRANLLDVSSYNNCGNGLRLWHSAHVENAYVASNRRAGVQLARVKEPNEDRTPAQVSLIASSVAGNGEGQLRLRRWLTDANGNSSHPDGYATVRLFNTIAYSSQPSHGLALEYNRAAPGLSISWDWNLLFREVDASCSPGDACAHVVQYEPTVGCDSSAVPTCDGSHPNSLGARPIFRRADFTYQQTASPG